MKNEKNIHWLNISRTLQLSTTGTAVFDRCNNKLAAKYKIAYERIPQNKLMEINLGILLKRVVLS